MIWNVKDYLPDFKSALNSFYDERLKQAFDDKSAEYKNLLQASLADWKKTQKTLVAIAIAIFLLLLIAYFWK